MLSVEAPWSQERTTAAVLNDHISGSALGPTTKVPTTQVKSSGGTNLVSSISFEFFVIGVLNKYGDVTDVGGDGGVVVHHGDGRLFGAHLQESLACLNTKSNRDHRADACQHVLTAVHVSRLLAKAGGRDVAGFLSVSPGSFPLMSGYW